MCRLPGGGGPHLGILFQSLAPIPRLVITLSWCRKISADLLPCGLWEMVISARPSAAEAPLLPKTLECNATPSPNKTRETPGTPEVRRLRRWCLLLNRRTSSRFLERQKWAEPCPHLLLQQLSVLSSVPESDLSVAGKPGVRGLEAASLPISGSSNRGQRSRARWGRPVRRTGATSVRR